MSKLSFSIQKIESGWLLSELYPVAKQRIWAFHDRQSLLDFVDELIASKERQEEADQ